jgi:hypothetical protein
MQIGNTKLRQSFNVWVNKKYDFDEGIMEFYGKPSIEQYPYYEEYFDLIGLSMFIHAGANNSFECHVYYKGEL